MSSCLAYCVGKTTTPPTTQGYTGKIVTTTARTFLLLFQTIFSVDMTTRPPSLAYKFEFVRTCMHVICFLTEWGYRWIIRRRLETISSERLSHFRRIIPNNRPTSIPFVKHTFAPKSQTCAFGFCYFSLKPVPCIDLYMIKYLIV